MNTRNSLLILFLTTGTLSAAHAGQVRTDGQDIILSTKGGLKLETEDKRAGFQIGGRLQWDYTQDESSTLANGVTTAQDLDVRRARIAIRSFVEDFELKAEFNVGESSASGTVEDLYLKYKGLGKLSVISVGKQRIPFGMEVQTSANDITSLERSAMTERYTLPRSAGFRLGGQTEESRFTYGVGVFEGEGNRNNDFDNQALAGRITYAPILTKNNILHLGTGYQSVDTANPANQTDTMNLEIASSIGPFLAQAEYFSSDTGPASQDGYYVQLAYLLNGGTRPYSEGLFKRVKPATGGSMELVLRHEDGDGQFSDIGLGTIRASQTTYGVNYYMNDNVRIGVNYMDGKGESNTDSGNELRMRLQFTY